MAPEQDQASIDRQFTFLYQQHLNAKKKLPEAKVQLKSALAALNDEMGLADDSEEVLSRQIAAFQHFRACKRRFDELRSTIYRTNHEARELDIDMWGALPSFTDPDD